MDRIGRPNGSLALDPLFVSRVGMLLGAVVGLAIGFIGGFAVSVWASFTSTAIVGIVIIPLATGALAAAIGRHPQFRWSLGGFVLLPIVALLSAPKPGSSGESSPYPVAALVSALLGLPTLCLGFYGSLWFRRSSAIGDPSSRDIQQR
jgi:hypothetical protein